MVKQRIGLVGANTNNSDEANEEHEATQKAKHMHGFFAKVAEEPQRN